MEPESEVRGSNPAKPDTKGAQRGGRGEEVAKLPLRGRDRCELLREWYRSGHWWKPSDEELLLFLEGEL